MKNLVLIIAAIYGMLSVILGAFGAHAFKKIISAEKLLSFEIGVRYLMYASIVLLVLGFSLNFQDLWSKNAARGLMIGSFLFSFSIFFLSFSDKLNIPTKILGPITPLGGLLMILGWASLIIYFIKQR